jgi:hypothetical protein
MPVMLCEHIAAISAYLVENTEIILNWPGRVIEWVDALVVDLTDDTVPIFWKVDTKDAFIPKSISRWDIYVEQVRVARKIAFHFATSV